MSVKGRGLVHRLSFFCALLRAAGKIRFGYAAVLPCAPGRSGGSGADRRIGQTGQTGQIRQTGASCASGADILCICLYL